ncbi:hypothetical protein L4D09_26620 [Photobacterium makurazakiensis]|uniref:hypothetical protein n=1 Tax=Photobacterium makurazakiensis TaxID=2910234 RepID=UPI003D0CB6DB
MFLRSGMDLTLVKEQLNEDEKQHFETLVRLGDTEELALWTIEHMIRKEDDNSDEYRKAYYN